MYEKQGCTTNKEMKEIDGTIKKYQNKLKEDKLWVNFYIQIKYHSIITGFGKDGCS